MMLEFEISLQMDAICAYYSNQPVYGWMCVIFDELHYFVLINNNPDRITALSRTIPWNPGTTQDTFPKLVLEI